jgi:hypothetical protein
MSSVTEDVETWDAYALVVVQLVENHMGTSQNRKTMTQQFHLCFYICIERLITSRYLYTRVHTALFTVTKKWEQPTELMND